MIKSFILKKGLFLLTVIMFIIFVVSLGFNLKQFERNQVLTETTLTIYNEALLKNRECRYIFEDSLTKKNRDKIEELEKYIMLLKEQGFVE